MGGTGPEKFHGISGWSDTIAAASRFDRAEAGRSVRIQSAEFLKSATRPSHYPEDRFPEVAFVGRSNVGKSSLINRLVLRSRFARTSNTPGRTQLINFFLINGRYTFVDLPGYGFARVPDAVRRSWRPMVERYLRERRSLRLVVLLMDIRRDPLEEDLDLLAWLHELAIPVLPVLTKVDKLSKNQVRTREKKIRDALMLPGGPAPVLFSARTGQGRESIWAVIEGLPCAEKRNGNS